MSLAVPIVAVLAFTATAHAASPDLTIAGYELNGRNFAFQGEHGVIIPHDITRNTGKAAAGPSTTAAYLIHGASEFPLGKRAVPRLGVDKQNADDIWDATHVYNEPIGPYEIELCADAANDIPESNEANNCTLVRNSALELIKVYVIRRTWAGHVGGVSTAGPVTEQYKSTNATLTYSGPVDAENGVFAYDFAGTVAYTDDGVLTPCQWTGGRSRVFGPEAATAGGDILFDYLSRTYGGTAIVDDAFSYKIRLVCDGRLVSTIPGPRTPVFFRAPRRSFAFGATEIGGSSRSVVAQWTWGFH